MNTTTVDTGRNAAIAAAIGLLGAAARQLFHLRDAAEDPRDHDDLHRFALDAFTTAGCLWRILPPNLSIDVSFARHDDPLAQIVEAHDLLTGGISARAPADVRSLVSEVGNLRRNVATYESQHDAD